MKQVARGVHQLTIQRFVNLYIVETATPGEWVLIDTGLPGSTQTIIDAVNQLFYPGTHPTAILLTHGHMDHAGSAQELAEHWNIPIIAHPLELPFLTGKAVYPPADPTVSGGSSLAFVSRFFPPQSFQLTEYMQPLDVDDSAAPYMPGWEWHHVPGHAPGQVAFFRPEDGTLIGADAFATAHHDSVPSLLLQIPRISRCGTPFTFDWEQARASVQQLAALRPQAIGCGHGPALQGPDLADQLADFAANFPVPAHGRYVAEPARTDLNGVEYLPPAPKDTLPRRALLLTVGLVAAAGGLVWARRRLAPSSSSADTVTPEPLIQYQITPTAPNQVAPTVPTTNDSYAAPSAPAGTASASFLHSSDEPVNVVHPEATAVPIDPQYLPRNPDSSIEE